MRRAINAFGTRLPGMRRDLSCYASVQGDRVRLAATHAGERVASGVLHLVAFAAIFATASVLVIVGIAGGVASWLHGNVWLANLITGSSTLAVLWSALAIRTNRRKRQRLNRLERRYERFEEGDRTQTEATVPEANRDA